MNKHQASFATVASVMSILFFSIINYNTTPHQIWFIYPSFAILQWPISIYFLTKGKLKHYSAVTSLILISFLIIENMLNSPDHIWFVFAIYPLLWWPILMYLGKYASTVTTAIIGSLCTIVYYAVLNSFYAPHYPWVIYPSFLVLWWPLAIYFEKNKQYFKFSIVACVLTSLFFITTNVISTENTIWAVYPIFAILWWPLSMYYYGKRRY
ncbi:hypothetical protein [Paenibacillus sp. IHBB 10380]|uniref:hypothetical protein n=1 Tax=Paenibacillus sp. IHBB 10380 TaxID=1566358 RepID=UPI0005CFBE0D|nr:hypothetical protein [Paenibacillus sp. IHBB 10380]AJS58225.1 hypothetical protein UB51_06630 [Paenibacillus sp. IHBB 10380]